MPSFEDRVALERQRVAAQQHQEKMSKRRGRSKKTLSPEQLEKARVEAIRGSQEWKQMVDLSQNPDFLLALKMYWEKYAEKPDIVVSRTQVPLSISRILRFEFGTPEYEYEYRKRTFEDSLRIEERPMSEKFDFDYGVACTHGYIELSYYMGQYFFQGKHENDPSEYRPFSDVFKIFYQKYDYEFNGGSGYGSGYPSHIRSIDFKHELYKIPKGLVIARNTEGKKYFIEDENLIRAYNTYETLDQFWERMAREVV